MLNNCSVRLTRTIINLQYSNQIFIIHIDFDTLNCDFLLTSLKARGFPYTWIHWIENSVLKGHSQVIVNGLIGKKKIS
jgi:hypothetical protein